MIRSCRADSNTAQGPTWSETVRAEEVSGCVSNRWSRGWEDDGMAGMEGWS
jgi:hypothetical protein